MVESTNQQINTWTGGMDLDTANAYLPENCYREAYNLRVTTDTNSNSGVLHNIEGVKFDVSFALPRVDGLDWNIIWTGTIRDYGVIVAKTITNSSNLSDGRVGIFRFLHSTSQQGHSAIRLFCSYVGRVSMGNNPSCTLRYEDNDNIKLYIADGVNPIRTWNIAPSQDTFNQGLADDSSMSIYPSVTFDRPEFLGFGKGVLATGTYQFGYQLFNKNGSETEVSPLTGLIYVNDGQLVLSSSTQSNGSLKGQRTNKSVKLKINVPDKVNFTRIKVVSVFWEDRNELPHIQILQDSTIPSNGVVYYECNDNKGVSDLSVEEFNMVTNVHFAPKLLESKNNILFASNISYLDNTLNVDYDARAYRFYAANTPDPTKNICVLSSASGSTSAWSQTAMENMNYAVDKEYDCINLYNDTSIAQQLYYDLPYDQLSSAQKENIDRYPCKSFVDGNTNLVGGTGKNITYRFIVGDLEESTQDSGSGILRNTNLSSDAATCAGMWVSNVTTTGSLCNTRFVNLSTAMSGTKNYSNPLISYSFKSLQRDEIYRYGIIFYDKHGTTSPVKWIGDIRTPSMSDPGFETFQNGRAVSFTSSGTDNHSCELAVRPLAIEFEVRNIPDNVVAYEIVRCERTESDRSILAQGVVGKLGLAKTGVGTDYINKIFPPAILHNSIYYRQYWTNEPSRDLHFFSNYYSMFVSPEISYGKYNFQNYIKDSTLKYEVKKMLLSCLKVDATAVESSIVSVTSKDVTGDEGKAIQFADSSGSADAYWRVGLDTNFNVFKPYYQCNNYIIENRTGTNGESLIKVGSQYPINSAMIPYDLQWSDYGKRLEHSEAFDGYNFVNWVEEMYDIPSVQVEKLNPIGPNGRCMVSKTANLLGLTMLKASITAKSNRDIIASNITYEDNQYINAGVKRSGIVLCNLKRTVVPYGGNTYQSRQFSKYITNGAYKVKSTTNKVDVFDGDTFIGVFDYIKTHYGILPPDQKKSGKQLPAPVVYYIPVESSINLSLTGKEEYHKTKKQFMQIEPGNVNGQYTQSEPGYVYNSVYSVQATAKEFMPSNQYDEYNKKMDVRTYHSEVKTNDEIIDSWTKFKPLNYIDVDTRYGGINNIRTFGNELIFWQDFALGRFSVLERTMITDESNAPLLLGTGGVLSRYDYVATTNGIKEGHHDCDTQSDSVLYWFDEIKQEICAYQGSQVTPISKLKKVQSYVKRLVVEKTKLKDKPFLEYDKIYNELLCCLSKDDVLVYNEATGYFTSFFTLVPDYTMMFSRNMFMVKDNSLYHFNSDTVNTNFDGTSLPIEFKYVVNKPYNTTKVFDNVEFTGLLNKENILGVYCNTETMTGKTVTPTDISNREYNYRFAVPRLKTSVEFPNRLRGRYLECKFKYKLEAQDHAYLVSHTDEFLNTYDDKYMVTNRPANTSGSTQVTRQLAYYNITGTNAETFEIPYIRTTFRVSKS